ncbi:MAG TPA: hypothetical protein DD640_10165 [Clostridiales bacterium]|nr:hypothetical protein [Clostridiales bacterium]
MESLPLFIGLDIGTSRAKAILLSRDGQIIARTSYNYTSLVTPAGGKEQDGREWWTATVEMVRELADRAPAGSVIRALSFSTQGGSLVLTDRQGDPLAPAIIWQDQRGEPYESIVTGGLPDDYIYRQTGWPLSKGLNLLQMLRLRETKPELFRRAHYFLSVPDFLALKLTGRPAVDCSNAGINQLLDVHAQDWDDNILGLLGIGRGSLADVAASGEVVGQLLPEVARDLHLPEQTLLVSGGHDQYCAALGAGAIHDRDRLIGTGTAWVLMEISRRLQVDPADCKAFSRHTVKGLWGKLISLESGGASLEWIRTALPILDDRNQALLPLAELDSRIRQRLDNTDRPFFHPYLGSCSYPAGSPAAKASFTLLSAHHDRIDMAAAVLEGVAMQASWTFEAFAGTDSAAAGLQAEALTGSSSPAVLKAAPVIMTGGASASPVWRQLLANCLNRPVAIPADPEVGCLGAAMLAGLGAGCYLDSDDAYSRLEKTVTIIEPDRQAGLTQERLAIFKRLQQALAHF